MNNKLIKRIPILVIGAMFLGSCGDFIDNLVTTEFVNEGDTRACITYQSGKYSERRYCDEQRSYPAQVKNFDTDRFAASSYTPFANTSTLEGLWLVTGNFPPLGRIRQACEIKATANTDEFSLDCKLPFSTTITRNSNSLTNNATVNYSLNKPGEAVDVQWNFNANISNNNSIDGVATGSKVTNNGSPENFTDNGYDMVKIADLNSQIGTFTAEKKAFGTAAVGSSISHDVYYFIEIEDSQLLEAYDALANDALVSVKTDFTPDNQLVLKDYNLVNKGLVFAGQETVLDVAGTINQATSWKKQKTRQLDFTPLGSNDISIKFLSNRQQGERFERPDTEAELTVIF